MTTLFALFPCRWERFAESAGLAAALGWRWTSLLEKHAMEKALFLSSPLNEEPGAYPATWRRFIRVGNSLPEEVANLFELAYEKEYDRVIFAETLCAVLSEEVLAEFLKSAADHDLCVLPAGDGSVLMLSMSLHLFPDWDFFRLHASGSVVEILSECHERNLSYRLMDGLELDESNENLKKLLQNTKKPERH